jgi:hypothetical protein
VPSGVVTHTWALGLDVAAVAAVAGPAAVAGMAGRPSRPRAAAVPAAVTASGRILIALLRAVGGVM